MTNENFRSVRVSQKAADFTRSAVQNTAHDQMLSLGWECRRNRI